MVNKPASSRPRGDAAGRSTRTHKTTQRGAAETKANRGDADRLERALDDGLAATFPASDPVSISPRP